MNDGLHFVDANIPMYAVGAAHPLKQPCVAILDGIADDDFDAVTDVEILQEILHRYTALGQRERAIDVARDFLDLVPDVLPITREDFLTALEIHERHAGLPARDSLHLAVMRRHSIRYIISADRHFDGMPDIVRLDPASWTP